MQIRIRKAGLLSTIQDLGRPQYLSEAVPLSGAMDTLSARIANLVLGNPENAATIEFTYSDAELIAETDLLIAVSGEGAGLYNSHSDLPSDKPLFITAGTVLNLKKKSGCRTYIAIAGGWDVPEVLGSKSTYIAGNFGGLNGRPLLKNDILNSSNNLSPTTISILKSFKKSAQNYPSWTAAKSLFLDYRRRIIRVIPGRELIDFTADSLLNFLSNPYRISERSNRMAYHLEGREIKRSVDDELLSTAVAPGTIQVTGNGNLILLMADSQTTGGYPRIAQVAAADIPICGQLKPGDEIFFEFVSRKEAEKLYIKQELNLRQLKASIVEKYRNP